MSAADVLDAALESNRPRPTAYQCLEGEHYAVARAALELAECVEKFLSPHLLGSRTNQSQVFYLDDMKKALIAFREASARVC